MRQITLTFLGEPRTDAADHAQETKWTMTVPLIVLAVFAISYGWVGIPEQFPVLGGIIPNWFHEFVGSTLAVLPEAAPFNVIPLLTSLVVALGGLLIGWLVYRNVASPEQDFLQLPVLKNKWYFDEIYDVLFVKPSIWFAETFVSQWMDRGLIDGTLHMFGRVTAGIGTTLRNVIDKPVINGFFGDGTGNVVKWSGRSLRPMQSGRVQQYMVLSLIVLLALAGLIYYFLMRVG
jgi:NADH-quinone oxidoreductase subunit L